MARMADGVRALIDAAKLGLQTPIVFAVALVLVVLAALGAAAGLVTSYAASDGARVAVDMTALDAAASGNPAMPTVAGIPLLAEVAVGLLGALLHVFLAGTIVALLDQRRNGAAGSVSAAVDRVTTNARGLSLWALATGAFGALVAVLASAGGSPVPGLATVLLAAGWGLGVLFVLPALVLEDGGLVQGLRQGLAALRSRWLEAATALLVLGTGLVVVRLTAGLFLTPWLTSATASMGKLAGAGAFLATWTAVLAVPLSLYAVLHAGIQVVLFEASSSRARASSEPETERVPT